MEIPPPRLARSGARVPLRAHAPRSVAYRRGRISRAPARPVRAGPLAARTRPHAHRRFANGASGAAGRQRHVCPAQRLARGRHRTLARGEAAVVAPVGPQLRFAGGWAHVSARGHWPVQRSSAVHVARERVPRRGDAAAVPALRRSRRPGVRPREPADRLRKWGSTDPAAQLLRRECAFSPDPEDVPRPGSSAARGRGGDCGPLVHPRGSSVVLRRRESTRARRRGAGGGESPAVWDDRRSDWGRDARLADTGVGPSRPRVGPERRPFAYAVRANAQAARRSCGAERAVRAHTGPGPHVPRQLPGAAQPAEHAPRWYPGRPTLADVVLRDPAPPRIERCRTAAVPGPTLPPVDRKST